MIDHESYVFEVVASKLREEYGIDNIYITGEEISNTPPKFPAVCIMQSDNIINTDYSTFNKNENVAIETYKIEVVSIDSKDECMKIVAVINDVLVKHGYLRTFNQPIKSADSNIYRRIARFKKVNSIGGN